MIINLLIVILIWKLSASLSVVDRILVDLYSFKKKNLSSLKSEIPKGFLQDVFLKLYATANFVLLTDYVVRL